MTVTASQIGERLDELCKELDEAVAESARWARKYAVARPKYEQAKSAALVKLKDKSGSVEIKKAMAELDCGNESLARWQSEVLWINSRAVLRAIEAKIEAVRSYAAGVKTERVLEASGTRPGP